MKETAAAKERKRIEQKLSQVGAKVANATDLARQAKKLTRKAEATLIAAQEEIDILYGSLEEDDGGQAPQ